MADLKKIKKAAIGIFWKEGETKAEDLAPQIPSLEPISPPSISASSVDTVDQTFYNMIEAELNKSMPVEFAEFYSQMAIINEKFANLDEPTRYKLAFHAAQTALKARNQTLSYASLLKAAERLDELLASEKQEFDNQNEKSFRDHLTAIRRKVEEITQGIKARENQLQKIEKEMEAYIAAKTEEKRKLESEKEKLIAERVVTESQINQLEQKKNERHTSFMGALQAHKERLAKLKADLKTHLKGIE